MVIIKLLGGLGNQLFQYAFGRQLAIQKSVPLKFDISWYKGQAARKYKLDEFNTVACLATPEEVSSVIHANQQGIVRKFYHGIQRLLPYYSRNIVYEQSLTFDARIFKVRSHVYLAGYWQNEKYFKNIEHVLRNELIIKTHPSSQNVDFLNSINSCNAVSVHIRRGDYVTNPNLKALNVLPVAYYQAAIQKIDSLLANPFFFVFSDDIPWVKESINFGDRVFFVEHNGVDHDHEDLRLMSACRHHIIANSSFSWWGAWLNPSPEKIVISPKKWYKNPATNSGDIVPTGWIRL